jgi:RNA-directed DNA polymerase
VLSLFARLMQTYHATPNKGLPIGNLISQHPSIFYLGHFDHWVKQQKQIRSYLRYMDDFVVFGDSRELLKINLIEIERFLSSQLQLSSNPKTQLNRCEFGLPSFWYRLFPHKIDLTPQTKKRFSKKYKRYTQMYVFGVCSEAELIRDIEQLWNQLDWDVHILFKNML